MAIEGVLQTLQRVATVVDRLEALTEDLKDFRASTTSRVERIDEQLANVRERLTRLEALREADRSQLQADIARFKAEVERLELRQVRQLPDSG